MIFRRSPASSSFVLAAARLRALQLDPWPRGGKDRAAARKIQKNSQPSSAAPVVTGLDPYALLTTMALTGADVSPLILIGIFARKSVNGPAMKGYIDWCRD